MAHPQIAVGQMAFSVEISLEYMEQAVAGTLQGVDLQLGGWARS